MSTAIFGIPDPLFLGLKGEVEVPNSNEFSVTVGGKLVGGTSIPDFSVTGLTNPGNPSFYGFGIVNGSATSPWSELPGGGSAMGVTGFSGFLDIVGGELGTADSGSVVTVNANGGYPQFMVAAPSASSNWLEVSGGISGQPVVISSIGGVDAAVSINFQLQGAGVLMVNGQSIGLGFSNPMTTGGDLIYGQASQAFSITQDTAAANTVFGTTQTLTVSSTGASKLLVCSVVMESASGVTARSVSTCVDNRGNTWAQAVAASGAGSANRNGSEIWYVANATSGVTSVTMTFSNNCSSTMRFYEIANAMLTSPLDVTAFDTGTGNFPVSNGPPTTAQANEILIGVIGCTGSATTYSDRAPGYTYDVALQNTTASANSNEQAAHYVTTLTGEYDFYATLSANVGWSICVAAFKGVSNAAAGAPARLAIGTTGQLLMAASTGLPAWQSIVGVSSAGTLLNLGYAKTALGGGSAATLGTIGSTGPTTAAQNAWVPFQMNGVAAWIPMWV